MRDSSRTVGTVKTVSTCNNISHCRSLPLLPDLPNSYGMWSHPADHELVPELLHAAKQVQQGRSVLSRTHRDLRDSRSHRTYGQHSHPRHGQAQHHLAHKLCNFFLLVDHPGFAVQHGGLFVRAANQQMLQPGQHDRSVRFECLTGCVDVPRALLQPKQGLRPYHLIYAGFPHHRLHLSHRIRYARLQARLLTRNQLISDRSTNMFHSLAGCYHCCKMASVCSMKTVTPTAGMVYPYLSVMICGFTKPTKWILATRVPSCLCIRHLFSL